MVGILLDNSAKHRAVIMLITPPTKKEIHIEGPAISSSSPIKRKKFDPIFAPSP